MLSGGQRKRVGLAQVLIRDPKILLMDEPFGPLDAQTRQIMGNLLLDLWTADRKAVLFVTHDLEEAIALADRVVIMSAGPARASSATGACRCRARATSPRSSWNRVPRAAPRNLERAEGRSAQGLRADRKAAEAAVMRRGSFCSAAARRASCGRLWHLLTTVPIFGDTMLPPFFFSTPAMSQPHRQVVRSSGTIWQHLGMTLVEAVLAFVIGSLGGVADRLLVRAPAAASPRFDPYVKMINALPRVVLAPIFALWLGLGIWSKVALGVTLVFFIVFFNVYQGVKEVSPRVLANARMLGMNERQLLRHVYWPSALSWMFSSLHTSVGFAMVGAVVGEYLGSAAGLGYLIQQAEGVFDVAGVFAGMFVLAVFVIADRLLVTEVENRLLVWRPKRPARHEATMTPDVGSRRDRDEQYASMQMRRGTTP